MSTMPAAVVTELGKVVCTESPKPKPTPGMVLVQTTMASICGSDLHIAYMGWNTRGFPMAPGHPGHEGVGKVIDGGGTEFLPGESVLTVPNIWTACAFAKYQLVDPQYLLKLPSDTPLAHLLMAQQLGTVIYGCKKLPPILGKTVVVIGQGSVGLFHDFVLRKCGAEKIITIEPIRERIEAAKLFGVDETIDVTGDRATEAVLELTNGVGADIVIEAVGSAETLNQALKLTRPLGRLAVFGLPPGMDKILFDWDTFFRRRLTMHSVHGAQDEPGLPDFQYSVDLIRHGDIDVEPFLTHQLNISRVQDAFNLAHSKSDGALKVSLTF